MSAWRPDEPVDGAGLPLPAHARRLAEALALTPRQADLLVSELRNALLPALVLEDPATQARAAERVLALADAICTRERGG